MKWKAYLRQTGVTHARKGRRLGANNHKYRLLYMMVYDRNLCDAPPILLHEEEVKKKMRNYLSIILIK
jgi:hypothetical protein